MTKKPPFPTLVANPSYSDPSLSPLLCDADDQTYMLGYRAGLLQAVAWCNAMPYSDATAHLANSLLAEFKANKGTYHF